MSDLLWSQREARICPQPADRNLYGVFDGRDFFFNSLSYEKNLTILKYQIKSVYKFFLQLSANSRDESNEFN